MPPIYSNYYTPTSILGCWVQYGVWGYTSSWMHKNIHKILEYS